ncbi:MAG: hypothetical protein HY660_09495, partial [Armatimonadetes bacterium]|nr:hypothetical protein [Armatimonadota bacterium]
MFSQWCGSAQGPAVLRVFLLDANRLFRGSRDFQVVCGGRSSPPRIAMVQLWYPKLPLGGASGGVVVAVDPEQDIVAADFQPVSGGGRPFRINPGTLGAERSFQFNMRCGNQVGQHQWSVTVRDAAGHASEPAMFSFTCGDLPQPVEVRPPGIWVRAPGQVVAGTAASATLSFEAPRSPVAYLVRIDPVPGAQAPGWRTMGVRAGGDARNWRFDLSCTTPGVRYTLRATLISGAGRDSPGRVIAFRDFAFDCVAPAQVQPPAGRIRIVKVNPPVRALDGTAAGTCAAGHMTFADPDGVVSVVRLLPIRSPARWQMLQFSLGRGMSHDDVRGQKYIRLSL